MTSTRRFYKICLLVCIIILYNSCKKTHTPQPCYRVTIAVTGTVKDAILTQSNGAITASATGASGFTFSLNKGPFQASGTFSNLPAGNYTVLAQSGFGCTDSAKFTIKSIDPCAGQPGPLFTAVRTVLQTICVGCHNNNVQQGGKNWTVDCNIVTFKDRIKARAVDAAGTPSQMPLPPRAPLSVADRQKITDWIAAGGTITN